MTTKLQLGTSRLEKLETKVLETFLDKTWIHFGDPEPDVQASSLNKYALPNLMKLLSRHDLPYLINKAFRQLFFHKKNATNSALDLTELYSQTNFQSFYYRKGDFLPFEDNSINFIFSEHFFEHLFFDEALSLFKECHRVLKDGGVLRICVPDADLRTYEPPETPGFPDIKLPFSSPHKHKTRWNIYMLTEALEKSSFATIPLRYCNNLGEYIKVQPANISSYYESCLEQNLLLDLSYIQRIDSLIVDGIKPA